MQTEASIGSTHCGRSLVILSPENDFQKGRPGNCQMYQDEFECTKKLTKDKCGEEAVESMKKHMDYILGMMECDAKE